MPEILRLSSHSVSRFKERVRPDLTEAEAVAELASLAGSARARSTPRWWMRDRISCRPGSRFLYPACEPRACLIVRGGAVVTVYARHMFRSGRTERRPSRELERRQPRKRRDMGRRSDRARRWRAAREGFE
jgi:hypothetical protein